MADETKVITGITKLFYLFLKQIKLNEERIAPLQLTGKLEDYLCKEFSLFTHEKSEGTRIALSNYGKKGQQKYDLAIIRQLSKAESNFDVVKEMNKDKTKVNSSIECLVEAKYLGNRHRNTTNSATDDIHTVIKKLSEQCATVPSDSSIHGSSLVALRSQQTVYGLVFFGFTSSSTSISEIKEEKKEYFDKCIEMGDKHTFRYHDLPKSYLRSAYEDVVVNSLGIKWTTSLKIGLWRLN